MVSIDRLRLYLKDQDTPNPLSKFTASLAQEGNEFLTTIPNPAPLQGVDGTLPHQVPETTQEGDEVVTSVQQPILPITGGSTLISPLTPCTILSN